LPIANGGSNASSFTTGQPLAFDGTRFVSTSTLSVPYGGTGWGNIVAGSILYGNGAGALATSSALSFSGTLLTATNASTTNLSAGTSFFTPLTSALLAADSNGK